MRKILLLALLTVAMVSCNEKSGPVKEEEKVPSIYPDYVDVTVPAGIAPLNFNMADRNAARIDVVLSGSGAAKIHVQGNNIARFPEKAWKKLLAENVGGEITVEVKSKYADGWHNYKPFRIHVSGDEIDYGITYRLISPGYEAFSLIGIYERDLSSFKERVLIETTQMDQCVNCHAFKKCDPDYMNLHVRGPQGGTFIRNGGELQLFDSKTDSTLASCVYPYWHPSGRYIAYSTNRSLQGFHQRPDKVLEVYDGASDIQVYDTETNELITVPELKREDVLENMPVFSADGRTIYYTSSTLHTLDNGVLDVQYNLCKVSFDPETGALGRQIDTVIFAEGVGKSVSFPKPSYDGKWLMYQLADYGCFGAWHHESDLWLLNLDTGETWPLDGVNSEDSESTHSWSSNSRWFVFGSRRDDGLHTRAYICHIDENGVCGKPFMLPQKNPRKYYDAKMKSYNIPEFVSLPVDFVGRKAAGMLKDSERIKFGYRSNSSEQ